MLGEGKDWRLGARQRRNLPPRKRFHTILPAYQDHFGILLDSPEPRQMMDGWWEEPHKWSVQLAAWLYIPLDFYLKLDLMSLPWKLGRGVVYGVHYLFLFLMRLQWINLVCYHFVSLISMLRMHTWVYAACYDCLCSSFHLKTSMVSTLWLEFLPWLSMRIDCNL